MSTQGDTHRRSRHRWRRTSSTVATGAVVAGLLVLSPGQADAAGTTYTVDNSTAAGCSDTPTTGQPYCSITAAYKAAAAGATITVGPGTYNERVDVAKAGITLDAPAGATVDGTGTTQLLYGFNITGGNVTVDGFTFTNQATAGVNVSGADSTVIRNVTVTGSATNGIRVVSGSNVKISQVTAKNNARAGILLAGATNSTVSSAETFGNQREGVSIQGGSGDVVEHVTTHDNANTTTADRLAPGINVTNWVPSAGAAAVPATDITVQRNVSYGNDDSGIQVYGGSQNVTVSRNLVYDNGDHGIDFSMASSGAVVSNTALRNFTAGINIESNAAGAGALATVADNVAMNNGNGDGSSTLLRTRGDIRVDAPSVAAGSQIDHDLVFDSAGQTVLTWGTTTYPSLDAFHKDVPDQEVHGLYADAKLDANDVPGAASPAIDAADAGAAGFTANDLNGNGPVDDPTVRDTGAGTPTFADLGALERTTVPANDRGPSAS